MEQMKVKKRYWLFKFDEYYPCGGMNDFVGSFDSFNEAKDKFNSYAPVYNLVYGEIFDSVNNTIEELELPIAPLYSS